METVLCKEYFKQSTRKNATHSSELDLFRGVHLFKVRHLYYGLELNASSQMRCLKQHVLLASASINLVLL